MAFLKKSHKNSYSPLEQVTALNTEQLTENESRGKTEILRSEMTFSRLALSLARDYVSVYYINIETGAYIEYGATSGSDKLLVLSSGEDFFKDAFTSGEFLVHPDDRREFFARISKKSFLEVISTGVPFTLNYRLLVDGKYLHYSLKTTQGIGSDDNYMIVGVKNVEKQFLRDQESAFKTNTYSQIALALASRYEVIYYVNIKTNEYTEYSSSSKYAQLEQGTHGDDFFADSLENIKHAIYPDDYPLLAQEIQRDRFLAELSKDSTYSLTYRLMLDGKPEYVNLRAVKPENDSDHIIVAVSNINDSMKREEEYKQAKQMATRDALTGIRNKHAYLTAEQELNEAISNNPHTSFAIILCDVNDLKKVNDHNGHTAGDEYIQRACKLICNVFKHSPVYRIGGDEFVIILTGEDFLHRAALLNTICTTSLKNKEDGGVVIACGMAVFDKASDYYVSDVFDRADAAMYIHKRALKEI
ncbi:MAG: GGDEF domain-containing protein [Lachnospiraceae bacterium]|nr:GGDEF domain-containing protein [Lachnospiraceae bacterium]